MTDVAKCELCGEPMPEGETMFKYHGYSGPCPKEPLPRPAPINWQDRAEAAEAALADRDKIIETAKWMRNNFNPESCAAFDAAIKGEK